MIMHINYNPLITLNITTLFMLEKFEQMFRFARYFVGGHDIS